MAGAQLLPAEVAARQVENLGFDVKDVSDVVATHLDYDHIGGLADFPEATLHTTGTELSEAKNPVHTRGGNVRYRPAHTAAIRSVELYDDVPDEVLSMGAVELRGVANIFLVPTPGHTLGHAAVAVQDPARGWLVHAGDSFMHRSSMAVNASLSLSASVIRGVELLMASNRRMVRDNHRKLRELAESGVRVFCSHDSVQYETLKNEGVVS